MDQTDSLPALGAALRDPRPGSPLFLERIVAAAREHLGADIGFLCEFDGDSKIVRSVSGSVHGREVAAGASFPLEDTYCCRMTRNQLPAIVEDGRHDPRVRDLPITSELDIGTYIGVPVNLPDGSLYGTLCCINHEVDRTLHDRDLRFMRALGDLIGGEVAEQRAVANARDMHAQRIRALSGQLRILFQPVVELDTGRVVGMEALARFDTDPPRSPDRWFADAWSAGMGEELELAAVHAALAQRDRMPPEIYMGINASPAVLQSQALLDALRRRHSGPVLIEVTEHAAVSEYEPLLRALDACREAGLRIAVDDFGAGYSGLSHLLRVAPHVVKLDMQLTRGIDRDRAKQALTATSVAFASRSGIEIIAEGVETRDEAQMLQTLGVRYGQGFYYGEAAPLH